MDHTGSTSLREIRQRVIESHDALGGTPRVEALPRPYASRAPQLLSLCGVIKEPRDTFAELARVAWSDDVSGWGATPELIHML